MLIIHDNINFLCIDSVVFYLDLSYISDDDLDILVHSYGLNVYTVDSDKINNVSRRIFDFIRNRDKVKLMLGLDIKLVCEPFSVVSVLDDFVRAYEGYADSIVFIQAVCRNTVQNTDFINSVISKSLFKGVYNIKSDFVSMISYILYIGVDLDSFKRGFLVKKS